MPPISFIGWGSKEVELSFTGRLYKIDGVAKDLQL
jgi:hypothetical protein